MKKIVITGGLGYIGTELCKIYSGYSWNDKITVIDNRFISERVNQIRNWNMTFIQGDILDKNLINKYCKDADVVIYVHTNEIRGREENHVLNYEAPTENFIDIDTGLCTVDEGVVKILGISPVPSKELKTLDKRKTLAVDFDGVIHKYSKGFQGLDNAYDPPMDGAREVLQRLKDKGYVLKIMSSRPALVIEEWLEKYEMSDLFDTVSNSKFAATIYLDDRGFHFTNWENVEKRLAKHPKFEQ